MKLRDPLILALDNKFKLQDEEIKATQAKFSRQLDSNKELKEMIIEQNDLHEAELNAIRVQMSTQRTEIAVLQNKVDLMTHQLQVVREYHRQHSLHFANLFID